MPYITEKQRDDAKLYGGLSAGSLNYVLTMEIIQYLKLKGESYQTYNDIIGALECCKLELYRRKIAFYEDVKMKENGDVY